MSYKVVQTNILNADKHITAGYEIVEKRPQFSEEVSVTIMKDEDGARKMSRHLNLGGGFDGFTPNFFGLRYNVV
jgi:hypothetical protein